MKKLTDEQPRKFVALLGKNSTRKKIEYGFAKIRQILGNFHNDEAMDLRCRCPVPCVRKEITIRNETGRRYQKNTARFHVSLFRIQSHFERLKSKRSAIFSFSVQGNIKDVFLPYFV